MTGHFRKIMLPLDGSEFASHALPIAQQLAQQLQAKLVLYRVVQNLQYEVGYTGRTPSLELNIERQQTLVDHATRWLQRLVDDLALHNVAAEAVVDIGEPGERILAYARADDIDLIVMGTHGRRGVPRLLHGSVAATVLADATCPVLLVRPKSGTVNADDNAEELPKAT